MVMCPTECLFCLLGIDFVNQPKTALVCTSGQQVILRKTKLKNENEQQTLMLLLILAVSERLFLSRE